ncbi:ABC-three component system protein [Nonomuraea sp. NPDC049750]|uniref:ABC-three component system protein n=1 Tax=Nonomuraea sp. NPDC049750 TaxID=3154738 RepID=UPI0033F6EC9A
MPGYEDLRRDADAVDRQIRELRDLDEVERHNLQQMVRASTDNMEPDDRYLEQAFHQLNVVLGSEVRRRFDEVRAFHQTVVHNREKQLREETQRVEQRLAEREQERERLGKRLASLLQTLNEGGALDALTSLQSVLAREQATLEALRNRFQAAQTLEASRREIESRRLALEMAMADDLNNRSALTSEASRLFNVFARQLYGQSHNPYLAFEARKQRLDIETRIDADGSRGIHNMVIFCFDLTAAVIAHRNGRGPDFLVHDSHLYDGVDERQVSAALELAANVMDDEGMQYIVSMNSDDLHKAEAKGFNPAPYVIEPRLTDQPNGGLLGFRF